MTEKIEVGETIVLDNGKEYTCYFKVEENNIDYLYLISNTKPVEIKFAKQTIKEDKLEVMIIEKKEEKVKIFELFKQKNGINI